MSRERHWKKGLWNPLGRPRAEGRSVEFLESTPCGRAKAAEHRLPQQTDQRMAAVPAGSRISECLARHLGQAECIVEFAVCQQSRVGRDHGPHKTGASGGG
jgi:hypothetical protein